MAVEAREPPVNRPPRLQPVWSWLWLAFGILVLVLVVIGFFYAGTMR
jgi:hypothetical protein